MDARVCPKGNARRLLAGCLPQGTQRLLADPDTAPLVTGLLKRDGGIARLGDPAWLSVSAPQS